MCVSMLVSVGSVCESARMEVCWQGEPVMQGGARGGAFHLL